jgi:hypothetical protein
MDFLSALNDPTDALWMGKRVFSPGFIALCVAVATIELVVLNGLYG